MDARRRKNILLTLWLVTPFLLIAGLLYAVAYFIQAGPKTGEKPPAVGAGAGETGGANAIGEALGGGG